jgi:hypothetical protein
MKELHGYYKCNRRSERVAASFNGVLTLYYRGLAIVFGAATELIARSLLDLSLRTRSSA